MARATSDGISLVVASGSVAATNVGGLAFELRRRIPRPVVVVLTAAALRFVTPAGVGHVGEGPVLCDEAVTPHGVPLHVWLTDVARTVVVYPASAGFIARTASGAATDLASTSVVCATGLPVLVVPSMHPRMWASPLVQQNITTLARAGMRILRTRDGTAPPVDVVVDTVAATGSPAAAVHPQGRDDGAVAPSWGREDVSDELHR